MHWIDWLILAVPVLLVLSVAFYSKRYVRGVVDYLAAGRVAGRYVMSVGDMQGGLSVLALISLVEIKYQTGFAIGFWENMLAPIGMAIALTGYCVYRYRETRSLSIGQFLEMRYNRAFRVFAATVRTISEMLTNAIAPAIAANFFIYFVGLPHTFSVGGVTVPTFAAVVGIVLFLAVLVMWPGGRISLMITDCVQGLMSYPIFILIAGYLYFNFSWDEQIAPVMIDRAPAESFLNPFDISNLRDFNLFALFVVIFSTILNRGSWFGSDSVISGKTPQEQKMAGILGAWRNGFAWVLCILLAVTVLTVMNHKDFSGTARNIRTALSEKIVVEIEPDPVRRAEIDRRIAAIPESRHEIGVDPPLSRKKNLDTVYFDAVQSGLGDSGEANYKFQKFRTLYHQMLMPVTFRNLFPPGMMGIFCLMMIMLMVSTDDSRIFNSSATLVQDIILPFIKRPLSPRQHLLLLRLGTVGVSIFFFIVSLFFVNIDFIQMFITIMTGIWLGGAGPVMIFGLYSRFGTTAGAFASIFAGSGISISGLFLQHNWAETVYPWLVRNGWEDFIGTMLENVSAPFSPYVVWRMNAVKFPINSVELYFLSMLTGLLTYILVSLITYRKPYNLDRLLHRGKYSLGESKPVEFRWSIRNFFRRIIGITPEYTRGDKIITYAVFGYSFVYQVILSFVAVLVWNLFSPWPLKWWSTYFFVIQVAIATLVGAVSTVWFMVGGIIDLRKLFRDLAARKDNPLDNGQVVGHVSLADTPAFDAREKEETK